MQPERKVLMDKIKKAGTESKINYLCQCVTSSFSGDYYSKMLPYVSWGLHYIQKYFLILQVALETGIQSSVSPFEIFTVVKNGEREVNSVVCYLGREFAFDMCAQCKAPLGCDCPVNATINNNVNKLSAQFLSNSALNLSFDLSTFQRQYFGKTF